MATIGINDLKLQAIVGTNDWERNIKQEVIVNISIKYDASDAIANDDLKKALDYEALSKGIKSAVEDSKFFLLETLTNMILQIVMDNPLTESATVRPNKPEALNFSESVSIELSDSHKS